MFYMSAKLAYTVTVCVLAFDSQQSAICLSTAMIHPVILVTCTPTGHVTHAKAHKHA